MGSLAARRVGGVAAGLLWPGSTTASLDGVLMRSRTWERGGGCGDGRPGEGVPDREAPNTSGSGPGEVQGSGPRPRPAAPTNKKVRTQKKKKCFVAYEQLLLAITVCYK